MDVCMDGWMDVGMYGMDGCRWMDVCMDVCMYVR